MQVHISIYVRACLCTRFYCCGAAQTAHLSLRLGSGPLPPNVHQKLSIRALWSIYFRTQGDRIVTLERFAGSYLVLCARLPMYKVALFASLKMRLQFSCFFKVSSAQITKKTIYPTFYQKLFQDNYLFFSGILNLFKKSSSRYIKKSYTFEHTYWGRPQPLQGWF